MQQIITLFLFTCAVFTFKILAQPPVQWSAFYGGSMTDESGKIMETKDGNFIVTGASHSFNHDLANHDYKDGTDLWIFKTDKHGNIIWSKTYGGYDHEYPVGLLELTDGSLMILAGSLSKDGDVNANTIGHNLDHWLLKLDNDGELIWSKTYGTDELDGPHSILLSPDGGFYIGCTIETVEGTSKDFNYGLMKLDKDGDKEWLKTYGGSKYEYLSYMTVALDGELVLIGGSFSNDGDVGDNYGHKDIWIIRVNTEGELLWEKNYGSEEEDGGTHLLVEADGMVITGTSKAHQKGYWIFKIDFEGNLKWSNIFGGSEPEVPTKVLPGEGDTYFIFGNSFSQDGDVIPLEGMSNSLHAWVIQLNDKGRLNWSQLYGEWNSQETITDVIQTSDGGFLYTSNIKAYGDTPHYGSLDIWLHKLAPPGIEIVESCEILNLSPNPLGSNILTLQFENPTEEFLDVEIFDAQGKLIASYLDIDFSFQREVQINLPMDLGNGLYFLKMNGCNGQKRVRKFVKGFRN